MNFLTKVMDWGFTMQYSQLCVNYCAFQKIFKSFRIA